jgi:toxin ParE1/3/4
MQIVYHPDFITRISEIWNFIEVDSKLRADKFKAELKNNIEDIVIMPHKCRKSIYFDDENIRDLIYKGYVIPYHINNNANTIVIIGINKYQDWLPNYN